MYSILDDWSMGPVHGSKIAIRLNSIYQLKGKEDKMTDGKAERCVGVSRGYTDHHQGRGQQ